MRIKICINFFLVKFTSSDLKWPRTLYIYLLLLTRENAHNNSLFKIPNYYPIREIRKRSRKAAGVAKFIQNALNCNVRQDQS